MNSPYINRRGLLRGSLALGSATLLAPGVFAEELTRTPRQTEGPFYPNKLPLDTDNDLLIINDNMSPSIGDVTHLTGRVLDIKGNPIKNAEVEIWQCDGNGVYLHTADSDGKKEQQDKNFQGFGRFLTGVKGEYYFRTIKPVPYPGRTPHIHFKVKQGQKELLVTQCYIKGHAGNERDGVWRRIADKKAQDSVTIDFKPLQDSKIGELTANFDIVIGLAPNESQHG